MCRLCHSWAPEKFPSNATEMTQRRLLVFPALESIVALPDRLNTEHAVEVVSCATRLAMLADPQSYHVLHFVLSLAAQQARSSLRTREHAERWLAYRDASADCVLEGTAQPMELMESTVLALLRCMREAASQHCYSPPALAAVRGLCASVAASLFEAVYQWQPAAAVQKFWNRLSASMPPPAGMFTFLVSQFSDSAQVQVYKKRGLSDSKKEREGLLQQNVLLRESLCRLCVALRKFHVAVQWSLDPNVQRAYQACVQHMIGILREPYYKGRDVGLLRSALNALQGIVLLGGVVHSTASTTTSRSSGEDANRPSSGGDSKNLTLLLSRWEMQLISQSIQPLCSSSDVWLTDEAAQPTKEVLKERYVAGQAVKELPLGDPWCRMALLRLLGALTQTTAFLPPSPQEQQQQNGSPTLTQSVLNCLVSVCCELQQRGLLHDAHEAMLMVLQPLFCFSLSSPTTTHSSTTAKTVSAHFLDSLLRPNQTNDTKTAAASSSLHVLLSSLLEVLVRSLKRREPHFVSRSNLTSTISPAPQVASSSTLLSNSAPLSVLGSLIPPELSDIVGVLLRLVQHTVAVAVPTLKRLVATSLTATAASPSSSIAALPAEVQLFVSLAEFFESADAIEAIEKLHLRVTAVRGGPLANITAPPASPSSQQQQVTPVVSQADVLSAQVYVLQLYLVVLRVLNCVVIQKCWPSATSQQAGRTLNATDNKKVGKEDSEPSKPSSSALTPAAQYYSQFCSLIESVSETGRQLTRPEDNACSQWNAAQQQGGGEGLMMRLQQCAAQAATVLLVAYSSSGAEDPCAALLADKLVGMCTN